MADVTLTLVEEVFRTEANHKEAYYNAVISGNYGANGFVVDKDSFPSSEANFAKIREVAFWKGNFDEDGNFYRVDNIDNADETNPDFELHIHNLDTGGGAFSELSNGEAFSGSIGMKISGVPLGGIVPE